MKNQNHISFVTDFFPLVASLLYFDLPLVNIDRNNPRHAYFEFAETKRLKDISERFWAGKLLVEPKRFFNKQKEIKSRLYEPRMEETL